MVKSGYAKGANSGHITQERTLKPKPARRKGVRDDGYFDVYCHHENSSIVSVFVWSCLSNVLFLHIFLHHGDARHVTWRFSIEPSTV